MKYIGYTSNYNKRSKTWEVRILDQTHRSYSFGDSCDGFEASNGFQLRSVSFPNYYSDRPKHIYLQGVSNNRDDDKFNLPSGVYKEFVKAVKEYNAHFSDKKPAPKVKADEPPKPKNIWDKDIKDISDEEFVGLDLYRKLFVIFKELKNKS